MISLYYNGASGFSNLVSITTTCKVVKEADFEVHCNGGWTVLITALELNVGRREIDTRIDTGIHRVANIGQLPYVIAVSF
jgi:hypothetical protein